MLKPESAVSEKQICVAIGNTSTRPDSAHRDSFQPEEGYPYADTGKPRYCPSVAQSS